jgi:hypothetical protein
MLPYLSSSYCVIYSRRTQFLSKKHSLTRHAVTCTYFHSVSDVTTSDYFTPERQSEWQQGERPDRLKLSRGDMHILSLCDVTISDDFTPERQSERQQGEGPDRLKLKTVATVTDRAVCDIDIILLHLHCSLQRPCFFTRTSPRVTSDISTDSAAFCNVSEKPDPAAANYDD